jgi:AcrR family transcriptional regulator
MEYSTVKMSTTPTAPERRPYRQKLRAESVAQTRQRILDAARTALTTPPPRTFNLSEVAERAGVVRSTIYTVFGSRLGLLQAVLDDVAARGGWERMRQAYRDPDTLAAVDADAAGVADEEAEKRRRGLDDILRRMREQGYLRPDLDPDEALDIAYLLSSFRTFDQLYTERGLDQPTAAARLQRLALATLCKPEALPRRGDAL